MRDYPAVPGRRRGPVFSARSGNQTRRSFPSIRLETNAEGNRSAFYNQPLDRRHTRPRDRPIAAGIRLGRPRSAHRRTRHMAFVSLSKRWGTAPLGFRKLGRKRAGAASQPGSPKRCRRRRCRTYIIKNNNSSITHCNTYNIYNNCDIDVVIL